MAKMEPCNPQDIHAFLEFGYIPESELRIPENIIKASEKENLSGNLIEKGSNALTTAFQHAIDEIPSDTLHLVPLSGGLDSRTILAALLDHVPTNQIRTVTFGTPGTWDFDYGKQVASQAGVQNTTIDLTNDKECWSAEKLQSYATESTRPTRLFERAVNARVNEVITTSQQNIARWSGYLGDPLAGSHLKPTVEEVTWHQATDRFISINRMTKDLSHPEFSPQDILPNRPKFDVLEYGEQLDYGIRQPYFIKPTVMFPDSITPFLRDEWVDFILRTPRNQRLNRRLYKQIVLKTYPELFSKVPTDSNQGLKLTAPSWKKKTKTITELVHQWLANIFGLSRTRRNLNYIDFASAFRNDMCQLMNRQLDNLAERDIIDWINIREIISSHLSGEDKASEIRLLIALEMYLKVNDGDTVSLT